MFIDVRSALRGEVREIPFDYTTNPPDPLSDVRFDQKMTVCGKFINHSGYMSVSLRVSLPYTTHCARCFTDIDGVFTLDFEKPAAVSGTVSDEDAEDYLLITKGMMDPDQVLIETLLMEFPMTFLCKEDCKGLCPRCGKNKNDGECGCPTKEPDPRLAVLSQLLAKENDEN